VSSVDRRLNDQSYVVLLLYVCIYFDVLRTHLNNRSVLFCSVLFCSVPFHFVSFRSVPFRSILFYVIFIFIFLFVYFIFKCGLVHSETKTDIIYLIWFVSLKCS